MCELAARTLGRARGRPVGRVRRRLRPDPRADRAGRAWLRAATRARSRSRVGSCCRMPCATRRSFRHDHRQGATSRSTNSTVLRLPPGRLMLQIAALARPVQHHDLRPRRPVSRHSQRWPARRLRVAARISPSSVSPTASTSTSSASGPTGSAGGPRLPDRLLSDGPRLRGRLLSGDERARSRWRAPPTCSNTPTSKSIVVRLEPRAAR